MSDNVFVWRMSARMHKDSVRVLMLEIRDAYAEQRPLAVSTIFTLLPLVTGNIDDVIARGEFILEDDKFYNEADVEMDIEFDDPVLKRFTASIPTRLEGSLTIDDEKVIIQFEPAIELEINRLAQLGVDRSKFQSLSKITVDRFLSTSVLFETTGENRNTFIEASLEQRPIENITDNEEYRDAVSLKTFGTSESSSCGDADPEDTNWYVYKRLNDGLCFVHYGEVIIGGQFQYKYGPSTQADCNEWENSNCSISGC